MNRCIFSVPAVLPVGRCNKNCSTTMIRRLKYLQRWMSTTTSATRSLPPFLGPTFPPRMSLKSLAINPLMLDGLCILDCCPTTRPPMERRTMTIVWKQDQGSPISPIHRFGVAPFCFPHKMKYKFVHAYRIIRVYGFGCRITFWMDGIRRY